MLFPCCLEKNSAQGELKEEEEERKKKKKEEEAAALTKTLQTEIGRFSQESPPKIWKLGGGGHHSGSYSQQKGWQLIGNKNYPKHQQSTK